MSVYRQRTTQVRYRVGRIKYIYGITNIFTFIGMCCCILFPLLFLLLSHLSLPFFSSSLPPPSPSSSLPILHIISLLLLLPLLPTSFLLFLIILPLLSLLLAYISRLTPKSRMICRLTPKSCLMYAGLRLANILLCCCPDQLNKRLADSKIESVRRLLCSVRANSTFVVANSQS